MNSSALFNPITIGNDLQLRNRIVMAPMTRSRAEENDIPSELAIEYYRQRADAGLIITEGTHPSIHGKGYARTPGIYSDSQIQAWQKITAAVHQAGSKIFLQLMHVGRVAHPLNKAQHAQTVAPSAVKAAGTIFTDQQGLQEMVEPRALQTQEISQVIEEYRQATVNAFSAGFDGVELHGASGYLPMQFLSSNTNLRHDQYGGPASNRIRFILETLAAMAAVRGPEKVGLRIWPGSNFNDVHDANPVETYTTLIQAVNPLKLAYLHVIMSPDKNLDAFKLARENYQGVLIINGGFNAETGAAAIRTGLADLVSFGSLYVANPDLATRFAKEAVLNTPDPKTFYTPGAKGYTDYPTL